MAVELRNASAGDYSRRQQVDELMVSGQQRVGQMVGNATDNTSSLPPTPVLPDKHGLTSGECIGPMILILMAMALFALLHMWKLRRRGIMFRRRGAAAAASTSIIEISIETSAAATTTKLITEMTRMSSIEALPCVPWDGAAGVECSLCLETLHKGDLVTTLHCAHQYHKVCIDRWLIDAQRFQKRRCPLCNGDPLGKPSPPPEAPCAPGATDDHLHVPEADEVYSAPVVSGAQLDSAEMMRESEV